jgi:deoxyribonuclease V
MQKGEYTLLKDKDEVIGAVLRTRTGVKPLFVSIGNLCKLDDAVEYTLKCCVKYRLPEPARLAHHQVSKIKKKHQ